MKSVIIIGSGVAGLATAIRLAVRGFRVTVIEANNYIGGKLTEIKLGGYRFDAGPSLYTMPQYQEELFALAGKNFKEYCPYEKLDLITNYFYPDGTKLHAFADKELLANEMQLKLGVDAHDVLEHLTKSKKIYDLTASLFLNQSLHKFSHYKPWDLIKAGSNFGSLELFTTMHNSNLKRLKEPRAVQYFDRFATYNGSNPYEAPATLNVIPHLEHNIGAFFPKNGMHSISQSMYTLSKELAYNTC